MGNPLKQLEILGRQWLIRLFSLLFRVPNHPLTLSTAPRILVVRLDERVGNLVLLTPLLTSLKQTFPNATIDLLANPRGKALLENHPSLNRIILFEKKKLNNNGPLAVIRAIRRSKYELAIDAGNPVGPSTTQTMVVWLAGASHTIGAERRDGARLFSQTVPIPPELKHEIDLRLQLLRVIPNIKLIRTVSIAPRQKCQSREDLIKGLPTPFILLNIGARLPEKRLSASEYAQIATTLKATQKPVLLTYGPTEEHLAKEVAQRTNVHLAPPTSLEALSELMNEAEAVVSCDTGPMHIAVAVGTPTFGIFVSTDPERFGYNATPHRSLDAQSGWKQSFLPEITDWIHKIT